jgi:hypothetical protein
LQELAERDDVERFQLQLNYRSASRIVSALNWRLGRCAATSRTIGPASGDRVRRVRRWA